VKRDWAAREVLSGTERSLDAGLRGQWSSQTLEGLDSRLSAFESALNAFSWPSGTPTWFQARLVTGTDDALRSVNGTVRTAEWSSPQTKLVTGGFNSWETTSLAPGAYDFKLTLGDYTESLSVDVSASDTWGDVLGAVKNAVNGAPLAVRADTVYQNAAYQLGPDMPGTGTLLTLSVNPARSGQDLRLADTTGSLLASLRMTRTSNPIGAAAETVYNVTPLQRALPTLFTSTPVDPRAATTLAVGRHDLAYAVGTGDQTSTYISTAVDPEAATTLAAGTYTFTSQYAGETRTHSLDIGSGWTWGQVLSAVASEINGGNGWLDPSTQEISGPSTAYSQPGVTASVETWSIPSSTDRYASTDGRSLTVTGDAGEEFTLSDTSGGLLSSLGLTTKLTGTPVSFNVRAGDTWEDALNSVATAVNGAQEYFTAEKTGTRIPSTVTPGLPLWHEGVSLALTQVDQRIGERVRLTEGLTASLTAMGISDRQRPGQDGKMVVNGSQQVSENNIFSQDKGRVLLSLEDVSGESVPLRVADGMQEVEKAWTRVTDAWNDLARYLKNNQDLLDSSLGARLEAPLASQKDTLRWLGVSSLGRSGQLWTSTDSFWKSLYADADRARSALWDQPDGLIPSWRQAALDVREARLDSWLNPATEFDGYRANLTSEFELEQKHRLVKLLG